MALIFLEKEIAKVIQEIKSLDFCDILRKCRESLGLMQCKAARFAGMTANRLKNLELGLFGTLPSDKELKPLAGLYGIKFETLKGKAEDYVRVRKSERDSSLSCMQ